MRPYNVSPPRITVTVGISIYLFGGKLLLTFFIQRLRTFFLFLSRFYVFLTFLFFGGTFFHLWARMGPRNHMLDGGPAMLSDVAMPTNLGLKWLWLRLNRPCAAAMLPYVKLL